MEQASSQPQAHVADSRALWNSIIANALARVGGGAISAMLALYQTGIGIDPQVAGFVLVAFYLTELTLAPVFGNLIDRQGWRLYMLLGPILSIGAAVLTWASALLTGAIVLPLLIASRLLNGVGIASNAPATLAFLSAYSGDNAEVRAKAVGYFELATIGGVAVGGLIGAVLYGQFQETSFIFVTIIFALSAFFYWLVPARLPGVAHTHTEHHSPFAMFGIRELWTFAPAWIVVNAIVGIWLNTLPNQLSQPCANPNTPMATRLCDAFGQQYLVGDFSPNTVGFILAAFAVVFCIGIVAWIRVLGRMRQSDGMLIALGGSLVVCAGTWLINRLPGDTTFGVTLVALLAVVVVALMVLSGFTPAALGILVEMAERNVKNRGVIMGAYSVLLGVGQFLGGALGGFFAARGGVNGLILLTLICTALAAGSVLIYRRTEPAGPPTVRAH